MRRYHLSEQTRQYCYQGETGKQSVALHRIVALINFADAKAGNEGDWVDAESVFSQRREYWIHDANGAVFIGASIRGDARLTRLCVVNREAAIGEWVCIHASHVSHHTQTGDNVTINHSLVRGYCHPADGVRLLLHCQVVTARDLAAGRDKVLQIYQQATVSASCILHQARIYGDTSIEHAFVEHRTEVFDQARLGGNEENGVWVCDNTRVYGHAQLTTGRGEDAISTVRYSLQMAENAVTGGNCLLKHWVMVDGEAQLHGGPILFDDDVLTQGRIVIIDDVIAEHQVSIDDEVQVAAQEGEAIHLRGPKTLDGRQHITRTPLLGALQRFVAVNNARVSIPIVIAAVRILSLPEATSKNESIIQRHLVTAGIGHPAFDHGPAYQPAADIMVDKGLQGVGKQPLSLVIFVNPVADIGRFVLRLGLVERQDAYESMAKKQQKYLGVIPLMQNHVTLHMAAGLFFAIYLGGSVERLLQPVAVFRHRLVQIADVALINRDKRQCTGRRDYFRYYGDVCSHGVLY